MLFLRCSGILDTFSHFDPRTGFHTGVRYFFDKEEPSAAAFGCAPNTNHIMEQMLICLSLALIAGLLMSRAAKAVRLPAVTAYLLTGLLLGPFFLGRLGLSRFGFGFGSLAAVEGYGILTQVALGFIAFVIGNEFRLSALKHMGRRAVTVGIAQAVITTALVDIALVALHFARPDVISLASAITLGSIAAATAPAATLMVVKQYKADGPLTKLLLMVVAIDDAVGLVLFSASYGVANALEQGRIDPVSVVLEPLLEIALSLALGAAAEAIADSGLDTEAEAEGKDIGVILSSGIGGLPTIEEQHARGEEKGMEKVSPYFVPMAIANMAAAQVAIRFGLKGMCTCPVTACAGGTNAVGDAFHRIRDGYETAMVCGGAESCISPLGIGGFTSMKALSTATDPDAASLPFDARRGGFVMGEGSGVLVLEELEHARARGAHIYAEVVGYGANCDAYHFTAPAPGGAGAIDCMALTLADAGIAPEQVDHINAHGTGTHMNDACETAAIHAVFGAHAKEMTVVSTKSMTGHLLGGAGGIEAVFTALALRDQFAPPTIHYAQPDPECDLDYVPNTGRQQEMQYALSNSLGFGGHNACIALRRWEG